MTNQTMNFRFVNATDSPIAAWLEPWAEEIEIKPGSNLELKIHYANIGTIETEQTDRFLTIWLWRGCRAQVFVDGEDRTVGSMISPAPV